MDSTQFGYRGPLTDRNDRAHQVDSVAWAVFFMFVGGAMLAHLPWGWFLVGIGLIAGAAQLARWQLGQEVQGFWVACAAVFLAGGAWHLLALPLPLAPMLLIALGVLLLVRLMLR